LYCLWRDRKAMLAHVANMIGYGIFSYAMVRVVAGWITGHGWDFARIFPLGSFLWWAVVVNTVLIIWRWTLRFINVEKAYGPMQGLLSVVRLPVGNVINFFALIKAARQWIRHKISGQPLRWASTAHTFPTTGALGAYQRRLGDLLIEREGLSRDDLDRALELQRRTGEPLGEVLSLSGVVSGRAVVRALSAQWSIPWIEESELRAQPAMIARLPESEAERLNVLPVGTDDGGIATVAVAKPLSAEEKASLEARLGMRIRIVCAEDSALRQARRRAYSTASTPVRLGEIAVASGWLSSEQLSLALDEQKETGEFLGDLLVRTGKLTSEQLEQATATIAGCEFRPVAVTDVDLDAFRILGYGPCAFQSFVPLISENGDDDTAVVACAARLDASTVDWIEASLRKRVRLVRAPALDLSLAVHLAGSRVWPDGLVVGLGGKDGAELLAASVLFGLSDEFMEQTVAQARANALSPVQYLLDQGVITQAEYDQIASLASGKSIVHSSPTAVRIDASEQNNVEQTIPLRPIRIDRMAEQETNSRIETDSRNEQTQEIESTEYENEVQLSASA
jgi:hypothetical protein